MGNTSDEVRLLDEEIKGIQGEIKSLEVMYEIHSLQQALDKYDEIPVSDVILSATEEKLLSKLKESNSPLLNFPTVCDQLEEYNRKLGILARSREDKLNKIVLNETTSLPQDKPEERNITFPLPVGARIIDIKMRFLDDENVRITINGDSRNFHYVAMGFLHKSSKQPLERWNTLLEYAEYNGGLRNVTRKKQKDSERINKKLKSFFVTKENLIKANRTVFSICKKAGKSQKPVNIQSKKCPACKETHGHFCFTCNDEQEHCKECHDELYKETHTKLNK